MVRSRSFSFRRSLGLVAGSLLAVGTLAVVGAGPAGAAVNVSNFAISPSPAAFVYTGATSQTASSETFTLTNNWTPGATLTFTVAPSDAAAGPTGNCLAGTSDYVEYAAAPTVSATGATGNSTSDTTPTFSTALSSNTANDHSCTGTSSLNDILSVIITNTPTGTNTDTFAVTISNITYSVGSAAVTGPIYMVSSPAGAAANANVVIKASATASGNSPATIVTSGAASTAVSNIVVTETAARAVSGSICVTPLSGVTSFTFSGTPTTTASTGTGAGTVSGTAIAAGDIVVTVTASTTAATTYTISGVSVINSGAGTGLAYASVTTGGSSCANDTGTVVAAQIPVFNSAPKLKASISGPDTDATAIAELEAAYPPTIAAGCVPSKTVVLATDQNFPDALSASYLAGYLHTGLLLTPTASLSSETRAAIQAEGITNVYVVGGPLAVSQNTISQITSTPAYSCGGPGVGTATGADINVTGPIFGQTQYDTSQDIAVTPPLSNVGSIDLAGAYANQYNDTTGNDSGSPESTGALKTAIVASGANFPDASAASVMAYYDQFPLVLTDPNTLSSQASSALSALGIKQVIVLGGPLAVSNADVTSIIGMGISVIRIAGQDATDTALNLASFELNQQGTTFSGLGWGATTGSTQWGNTVLVARGDFYSDALAGSVLAHIAPTPLLLTEDPTSIGTYLPAFLNSGGSTAGIDNLNLVTGYSGNIQVVQPLGGPLALNASTLIALVDAVATG